MRIVFITNTLSGGGIERQAVLLYRELRRRGVACLAVSLEDSAEYLSEDERAGVVFCHKKNRKDTLAVVRKLRGVLGNNDILMGFSWYPCTVAWIARPRSCRVMCFGGMLAQDGVNGYRRVLARMAAKNAAGILGCSWGVARDASQLLQGVRILCGMVHNAVEFFSESALSDTARSAMAEEQPYLLHVGRLELVKDQETLLRAFALISNRWPHRLLIAGDGSRRDALERLAEELGVSGRVEFLGFVKDTLPLYRAATLVVLTSRVEGFGTVLVEALANGLPVVSTDAVPGPREILARVEPSVWRLVPVGDAEAVATAMESLIGSERPSPEVRRHVASLVRDDYSTARITDAYLAVADAARKGTGGR